MKLKVCIKSCRRSAAGKYCCQADKCNNQTGDSQNDPPGEAWLKTGAPPSGFKEQKLSRQNSGTAFAIPYMARHLRMQLQGGIYGFKEGKYQLRKQRGTDELADDGGYQSRISSEKSPL